MNAKATDKELADFLIGHIENPCIEPQTGSNIGQFYIREAERVIGTFTDAVAEKMLRETIFKYSS